MNTTDWSKLLPKVDLPAVEGEHPHAWLTKCKRYFRIYDVEEGEKVELASLFLL